MKVAIVTRFPNDPDSPSGGVESVSVNLVDALARLDDLELHVVTTNPASRQARHWQWNSVTIHTLPWGGATMLTHALCSGRREVRACLKRLAPEVIHSHDVYGLMVKGLDIPSVFTIHGFIYADTLINAGRFAWLRSKLWKRVETANWADQPHIISISPYVRQRLNGIATGAIHEIDNPISDRFFHIKAQSEPGRIFSAAWISPRKNTLGLLKGFALLIGKGVKTRLYLAGAVGDERYMQSVQHFITHNDLTDSVTLLGRIDYQAISEQLARAAVFVLASLEENSPMGIEEAMAAALPVVTSNRCGMPYMVRDGQSGYLIDPHDPQDIAQRLGQILDNDQLRVQMGQTGKEIALDRFHPDKVAARTRQVYLQAIADHHRQESHG